MGETTTGAVAPTTLRAWRGRPLQGRCRSSRAARSGPTGRRAPPPPAAAPGTLHRPPPGPSSVASAGQPDGHPPRPPASGLTVEDAGDGSAARLAAAVAGQAVAAEAVPVPLDHHRPAAGTERASPLGVVDVAGVDVAQPVGQGDATGPRP